MEVVIFNKNTIRDFLRTYGKGSESKDYEFLTSIVLSTFCEEQWKERCVIGFKLKDKYSKDIPSWGSASIEQVRDILRKRTDEDTPVDIVIAPISKMTSNRRIIKGEAFQLKRLGKNFKEKNTQSLIDYLNNIIPRKYAKTKASLFLILERGGKVDFKEIQEALDTTNYPFHRIMFLLKSGGEIRIGEIWPNFGFNEYHPRELLKP